MCTYIFNIQIQATDWKASRWIIYMDMLQSQVRLLKAYEVIT